MTTNLMDQSDEKPADALADKLEENILTDEVTPNQLSTPDDSANEPSTSAANTTLEIGDNQNGPVAGPSHISDTTGNSSTDKTLPNSTTSTNAQNQLDNEEDKMLEDFVILDRTEGIDNKYNHLKESFMQQMERYLKLQLDKCDYYKKISEQQRNVTLATKFDVYSIGTVKQLELLKETMQKNGKLPQFRFEHVTLNCLPTHFDVKEKELQLVIKTSDLPVDKETDVYIIAEFEFPYPKDEPFSTTVGRWLHNLKIDPKNVILCSNSKSRQLDTIYATKLVPFTNPESKLIEYNRPLSFYVDKGKSRTLKRKFKPVKLTFYERRGIFRWDKKLGVVQVKIDEINDEITSITRLPLIDGRRQTEAIADVKVKVREPLVNKSIRAHEEKILVLY